MRTVVIYIYIFTWSLLILPVHQYRGRGKNLINFVELFQQNYSARQPKKIWSLLTVVKFPNYTCESNQSSSNKMGTCFTMKQCKRKRGLVVGNCARGFGVCCVFDVTCGGRTQQNVTYFSTPGYPNAFVLPSSTSAYCDLEIIKLSENICQVRLDFINFELFGVQEGECLVDLFTVNYKSGSMATLLPQLCGSNSGQHVYIDFPRGRDMIELRAIFQYLFDNPNYGRTFEIKISQIECNSELLAPPGCLLYFTGQRGIVSSFNYAGEQLTEGYPINQNYGICFRKEAGYCAIRYTSDGHFQFGISDPTDPSQAGNNCTLMAVDNGSRDDYLIIPGGKLLSNSTETVDRYCGGEFFNVTTMAMPYVINVISGDKFDGEVGFRLIYEQIPCQN